VNEFSLELAERHGALRARIAAQRERLANNAWPVEKTLDGADKALAGVDWLKQHPGVVAAAAAVLVVASPKRVWRWSKRGYFAWQGWQAVRSALLGPR
jgi:hypothetical protein